MTSAFRETGRLCHTGTTGDRVGHMLENGSPMQRERVVAKFRLRYLATREGAPSAADGSGWRRSPTAARRPSSRLCHIFIIPPSCCCLGPLLAGGRRGCWRELGAEVLACMSSKAGWKAAAATPHLLCFLPGGRRDAGDERSRGKQCGSAELLLSREAQETGGRDFWRDSTLRVYVWTSVSVRSERWPAPLLASARWQQRRFSCPHPSWQNLRS